MQDIPLCLCRMEQNVGIVGATEVIDDGLHETEATRALLAIAYEQGTINEDLLLFTFAKNEDERKGSRVEAYIPGACFSLDAQRDSSCLSMFRFTKAEIRRLSVGCCNYPKQRRPEIERDQERDLDACLSIL